MILATPATLPIELNDADRDDLTKIASRRYFERRLAECVTGSEAEVANRIVLLLDLDRFKAVNDSLGHAAGDVQIRF